MLKSLDFKTNTTVVCKPITSGGAGGASHPQQTLSPPLENVLVIV